MNTKLNTTTPTQEQIAAAPVVTAGTCAFIKGTRAVGSDLFRGVDITPLFQFNNVWECHASMNHTPEQIAERAESAIAKYNAGNLEFAPFWANPLPGAIYGAGYDAQRKADAERNAQALRLAVGDYVIMRGVVLQIVKAPNDNVWLVEVAQVPVEVAGEPAAPAPVEPLAPVDENRIISITVQLLNNGRWAVYTIKQFAPKNGGGVQMFTEYAPDVFRALDAARGMATLSPGRRTDAVYPAVATSTPAGAVNASAQGVR